MSIQVKELIDKIKNEGVLAAESEAEKIVAGAEERAAQIIKDAQAKAEAFRAQAEKEIEKQEAAGKEALKQAARDVLIGLEKQIMKRFEAVIGESVDQALAPSIMEKIVVDMVHAWAEKGEAGIKVILSSKDAEKLKDSLRGKLSKRFKEGVEIIPSAKFSKGFRIGGSSGALYDFSKESIAEVLAEALSPDLAAALKEAI
ncbi:MAG TPA: V-type ATP synthase subunit E [Firmicutes bacterium]|jgi:V/A-type H+-transporting ATPase subunit E|nr:V-type ATP synthase subunit E [Bacillota bacterium]